MNAIHTDFENKWNKMTHDEQSNYLVEINTHMDNIESVEVVQQFELMPKTQMVINSFGYDVSKFDAYQLECIQELVKANLNGSKFINPNISGWTMNLVMFAIAENSKYITMLDYMDEKIPYGTLDRILKLQEIGAFDFIEELMHIWINLAFNDDVKFQLQALIMKGISCKSLYDCDQAEILDKIKILFRNNSTH